MKKYLLFFAAWLCMGSSSCVHEESDAFHRAVKVTNNADYAIYIANSWVWTIEPEFPWNTNEKRSNWRSDGIVNPGQTNTTLNRLSGNNSIEGSLGNRSMKFFFVDAAAYDRIPIGDPLPDELLLDSRVYTLDDLRAIDFHVHYLLE